MRQLFVYLALLLVCGIASAARPIHALQSHEAWSQMDDVSSPEIVLETRKEPVYPRRARALHLDAQVVLQVTIDGLGRVIEAQPVRTKVSQGKSCGGAPGSEREKANKEKERRAASREFEAAAVEAVKQWRYRPARLHGVPTTVIHSEVVKFDSCPDESSP